MGFFGAFRICWTRLLAFVVGPFCCLGLVLEGGRRFLGVLVLVMFDLLPRTEDCCLLIGVRPPLRGDGTFFFWPLVERPPFNILLLCGTLEDVAGTTPPEGRVREIDALSLLPLRGRLGVGANPN